MNVEYAPTISRGSRAMNRRVSLYQTKNCVRRWENDQSQKRNNLWEEEEEALRDRVADMSMAMSRTPVLQTRGNGETLPWPMREG